MGESPEFTLNKWNSTAERLYIERYREMIYLLKAICKIIQKKCNVVGGTTEFLACCSLKLGLERGYCWLQFVLTFSGI